MSTTETWIRSDLATVGLGRGLVIRVPRVALTYSRSSGTYAVTGHLDDTQAGLSLGNVLSWCADHGVPKPLDTDLAWMEYRT